MQTDNQKSNALPESDKPESVAIMDKALRNWNIVSKELLDIINTFKPDDSGSCLGMGFRICALLSTMERFGFELMSARNAFAEKEQKSREGNK